MLYEGGEAGRHTQVVLVAGCTQTGMHDVIE
jgi:hypothetical protein